MGRGGQCCTIAVEKPVPPPPAPPPSGPGPGSPSRSSIRAQGAMWKILRVCVTLRYIGAHATEPHTEKNLRCSFLVQLAVGGRKSALSARRDLAMELVRAVQVKRAVFT